MAALVGGGLKVKPGEVSLAHNGVLFLDELPEFSPQVIDSLRQPLESGETIIARANNRVTYPSQFQLVAAMNPCKCGMAGTPGHTCRRGARCAADYQARLSGPFLDRIDIRIDVPAVSALDMIDRGKSEASEAIAQRVARARQMQHERFAQLGALTTHTNARASADSIEKVVELKDNSKKNFWWTRRKSSIFPPGPITGCSRWRGPWPIWTISPMWSVNMWPKHWAIG